ncbi:RNA-binding protein [Patescibacteria group bacterium]|nr:RNA-binding protein [Patescibacteria group bacterium]
MDTQNQTTTKQFKVFVGNLPYSITEAELKDVFMTVGGFEESEIVEVIILKEKDPRDPTRPPRSRGIGFVGFTNEESMNRAIEKVNGTEVEYEMRGTMAKRPIFVNAARPFVPKEERGSSRY